MTITNGLPAAHGAMHCQFTSGDHQRTAVEDVGRRGWMGLGRAKQGWNGNVGSEGEGRSGLGRRWVQWQLGHQIPQKTSLGSTQICTSNFTDVGLSRHSTSWRLTLDKGINVPLPKGDIWDSPNSPQPGCNVSCWCTCLVWET